MRLWRLVRPSVAGDERDREAGPPECTGASSVSGDGRCEGCGIAIPWSRRVQPLALEWPSNEPFALGDFTWPAGTYLPVVTNALASELRDRFGGAEPGPVTLRAEVVKLDGAPGRRLPAWFADAALELAELWVTKTCRPDAERSTTREAVPPCARCGRTDMYWGEGDMLDIAVRNRRSGLVVLEGVEFWTSGDWDPVAKALPRFRHPREEGRGIYVTAAELGGAGIFQLEDEAKFVLCTDEVKAFLEQRGCTNVGFLCAGEVAG